jgi:hypothetical protein
MTNRQTQRDAQRDRRRQERQRARREVRQSRSPEPLRPAGAAGLAPAPRGLPWVWIVVGAVMAVVLGTGLFFLIRTVNTPLPGQNYASLGNIHINPGDSHPVYNSNPPTSGWHFPTWPNRGIYTTPLPEEYLLHFQEHAGVVVHYNPDKIQKDDLDNLTGIAKSELNHGQGLLVMAPDPSIPDTIDITAWQHLESFDTSIGNKSKIEDFVERLECAYDPEGVCGPPHGNSIYPTGTPAPGVATVVSGPIPSGVASGNVMPGQKPETPLPGSSGSVATPVATPAP